MTEITTTPLVVRKEPGDPQFYEYLDQAREIARTLQVGTELIYTGPDTYKFVDWAPIPHGAKVVVVGHIPCKSAVTCRLPDGTLIGLNIYNLGEVQNEGTIEQV